MYSITYFSVGGTAGTAMTCPLEVVKTRLQSSESRRLAAGRNGDIGGGGGESSSSSKGGQHRSTKSAIRAVDSGGLSTGLKHIMPQFQPGPAAVTRQNTFTVVNFTTMASTSNYADGYSLRSSERKRLLRRLINRGFGEQPSNSTSSVTSTSASTRYQTGTRVIHHFR